jgi:multiple sugar transport system permease protein
MIRSSIKTSISILLATLFLGPILWVLWGSVRYGDSSFSFLNFSRLFTFGEGISTYIRNTLIVVLITVTGSLIISLFAGYAFDRIKFKGSKMLFIGILTILMVPHASLLIPLFIWLNKLHLGNSLIGLSFVMIMYQMPFSVFMMRNSFESVPKELDEAAMIDGCSRLGIIFKVLLPAVRPGLITVGLFAFLAAWNEFITALILLNDGSKFTMPLMLVNLVRGDFGSVDFGALQAGIVISAAPCVALFFILQKYFVGGFSAGAIKG